jgi:hypothetical protein
VPPTFGVALAPAEGVADPDGCACGVHALKRIPIATGIASHARDLIRITPSLPRRQDRKGECYLV